MLEILKQGRGIKVYHSVKLPTVIRKRITVKSFANGMKGSLDEKLLDLSTAKLIYNFNSSSGVLKRGIGIEKFNNFTYSSIGSYTPIGVYYYNRYDYETQSFNERIIYYASDKHLYVANANGGAFTRISDVTFLEKPTAISYNYLDSDVMIFASSSGDTYMLDDYTLEKIDGAPPVTSLCIHKERLFVTTGGEGTSLWFSDDFDPTNWAISLTEAGFIDFHDNYGRLLKVVSFLDYVYVFREYGISRVIAYGDQESFTADNLYGKFGKLYGESVTDCGDFIVMLTSAGIFRFNGLDTVKILHEYDDYILGVDNSTAKGVYVNNVLYFYLKMKINGTVEDVILVYDYVKNYSYIARGLKITDLTHFGGNINKVLCVLVNDKTPYQISTDGCIKGVPLEKEWVSPFTDFGVLTKLKRVYKVSLYSLEEITLTLETENKKLVYKISGGHADVYPSLQGERFRISIKSKTTSPEICNLTVYVEYFKGDI